MQRSKNKTSIIIEKTTTLNVLNTVVEVMQSDNINNINTVIDADLNTNNQHVYSIDYYTEII